MSKYIDLTNKRFGKILVLERDYSTGKTGTYWKCQCDCGSKFSCRRDQLTKYNKTSCGCDTAEKNSKAHLKDETGKRYGKLMVLERAGTKEGQATWLCQCDCGNKVIIRGSTLRNGESMSCGCNRHLSHNKIDEVGNVYGKLTVLYEANEKDYTHVKWHCRCECGNECDVTGVDLRQGLIQSCGCDSSSRSAGEQAIYNLLTKNNINFKTQYTFIDCVSPNTNNKLRFDFAILNKENMPQIVIEYNGAQHYKPIKLWGGEEAFQQRILYDNVKKEYCLKNNILLIIIPYTQKLSSLTLKDLGIITKELYELPQR